jgi:dihydropyrimidinase
LNVYPKLKPTFTVNHSGATMGLLIKNGEIVTSTDRYVADIWCEGETISKIGVDLETPPGAEVIDATGKYVFPGFIDPHTHIYLPFMGTFGKDDYDTGTVAALCGGTTTCIDFVIPGPTEQPLAAVEAWRNKSEGIANADYTWHLAVTGFGEMQRQQIQEIVASGVSSFKIFLGYKGSLGIEDDELYALLTLARKLGVITASHCEHGDIVAARQKELLAEGKTGPEWHHASRPPFVEAEGTRHFCSLLEATGAHGYVVHCSCESALRHAIDAKLRGTDVWIETLITHLLLDKTHAELPNFEGAKYVMSPPLRDKSNQAALWNGLKHGIISTVATDHAPFDTAQKRMGIDDFSKIPNGIPAIEDRVRMFYTHGVEGGLLDIHRFVDAASTQPAKIFGLYPRKGTIRVGADADLVVYDRDFKGKLSVETQHQNVDYNAFEGRDVSGRCSVVTVRGNVQVRDGEFVGKKGIGRFVKRDPNPLIRR